MFDDNVKCVASYLSRWCVTVAEAICFVAPSGGQFLIKKRQQDILLHCSCCCVGQSIYIQRYIKYRGISESWLQKEDMSLFQHRPSIEDHGRTLRCQALNPAMPLQSIQDTLVLDIYCEYSTVQYSTVQYRHDDDQPKLRGSGVVVTLVCEYTRDPEGI